MSNEDHDNDTCPNYATATRWMSAHGYCVTENKRLLAENADLKDRLDKAENQVEDLEIENARLKAEVERLTKAGDAMAEVCGWVMARIDGHDPKLVTDWNAAKEGKQTNG